MFELPEGAKEVFKGERCTIYQWPQKMYDGSIRTFETVYRSPAATIIATQDGKIVIQEQSQPHRKKSFLCFPGGHVDRAGEDVLETAKRELLEESGLVSEDWQLWKEVGPRGYVHWEHSIFIARDCQKMSSLDLDGGEIIHNRLVTLDELLELTEDPRFRHKDFLLDFYRIKHNVEEKEEFRKLLGF